MLVRELVRAASDDLEEHLKEANQTIKLSGSLIEIEPLFTAAFERIDSDIGFAVVAARRALELGGSPTINIYQSQGIVQTGAG